MTKAKETHVIRLLNKVWDNSTFNDLLNIMTVYKVQVCLYINLQPRKCVLKRGHNVSINVASRDICHG